jgi:hypothetical protein
MLPDCEHNTLQHLLGYAVLLIFPVCCEYSEYVTVESNSEFQKISVTQTAFLLLVIIINVDNLFLALGTE